MTTKMKAATQGRYGLEHIGVQDVPVPEPASGMVRVAVNVASINPADWHLASGTPMFLRLTEGLRQPNEFVIGRDVAGTVDAVGAGVTNLQPGDRVFGSMTGGFAPYALAKADRVARIPDTVDDDTAAGLPIAGVTALQALEKGGVGGKTVVINGASGGVGHFAVQMAKTLGATSVTGVCSGRNAELVASLGADRVVDYTKADFTDHAHDVIIDCAGSRSTSELKSGLTDSGGRLIMVGPAKGGKVMGPLPELLAMAARFAVSPHKLTVFTAEETAERLERLAAMAADGSLITHIDRDFKLADISDAFQYLGTHRAKGKVLIRP